MSNIMERVDASSVVKYVKTLSKEEVSTLYKHYKGIVDNESLATHNDLVWFFVLKDKFLKIGVINGEK